MSCKLSRPVSLPYAIGKPQDFLPPPKQDRPAVDAAAAVRVVQQNLRLQGPMRAKELFGGLSGTTKLYDVDAGTKRYVVRFAKPPSLLSSQEIACMKIASEGGYGPRLYAARPDRKYVIMDYVASQPVTSEDRMSGRYYRAIGTALAKMHNGPAMPPRKRFFEQVESEVHLIKGRTAFKGIVDRLEGLLPEIRKKMNPEWSLAACHNDLHTLNMIYTGSSVSIIDFADAGQDEPYYDLATVLQFNCSSPQEEKELLNGYFGRPMTAEESARLNLMKLVVRVRYTACSLEKLPNKAFPEAMERGVFKALTLEDCSTATPQALKKQDLSWVEDHLRVVQMPWIRFVGTSNA